MTFVLDTRTATRHFPGIGRYVTNLSHALDGQLKPTERLLLITGYGVGARGIYGNNVAYVATSASPFSLNQQWMIPALLRNLRQGHQPLIYHSPYYLMPYWPGVPTVLTFYDLIPLRFPGYVSLRARLLFRYSMKLALRTANYVLAISEASRRDLLATFSFPADRVTTTPLAADSRFSPQPAANRHSFCESYSLPESFLLYVGINKPHKNLMGLIEAYARLGRTAAPLVIAGAWDDRYPEPKRLAEKLNLGNRVRFLGPIDDADLPALYSAATAFVFPSRYEGFGLPVLEAMACGTPVACSNVSSLPEVAGDAALLFDPENADAIAAALNSLLADSSLRDELRGRGLAQAARFSWERTAAETLAVYRRLANMEGTS